MLNNLTILCAGLIDYPMCNEPPFLGTLVSEDIPNNFELFPVSCQTAIRRDLCANAYGKCSLTENFSVFSNTIVNGTPFSVPFQRPCVSVCDDIQSSCAGLPSFLGYVAPNCSERVDYSNGLVSDVFPLKYDTSNNISECNGVEVRGIPSTPLELIGSTVERYLPATTDGVCSGLVESVYIPPVSSLESLGVTMNEGLPYSPLQPPLAIQSVLESTLVDIFDSVPIWLSRKCYIAMKTYMCNKIMKESASVTMGEGMFHSTDARSTYGIQDWISNVSANTNVTGYDITNVLLQQPFEIPLASSQSTCQTYATECGDFFSVVDISQLESIHSYLSPDCMVFGSDIRFSLNVSLASDIVDDGLLDSSSFVDHQQVLFNPHVLAHASILSSPDSIKYEVTCPVGFAEPRNIDADGIFLVMGTGCAESCKTPRLSPTEWDFLRYSMRVVACTSIVVMCLLIGTWLWHPIKHRHYLVLDFFVCTLGYTITYYVPLARPFMTTICADETTHMDVDVFDGASVCLIQGFCGTFFTFAVGGFWWAISVETLRKLQGKTAFSIYYFEAGIFGYGLGAAIYLSVFGGGYYSKESASFCTPFEGLYVSWIPGAILVFHGFVNTCKILSHVWTRLSKTSSISERSAALMVLTGPLKFLSLIFMVNVLDAYLTINNQGGNENFTLWMECVLYQDWHGVFTSWTNPVCGSTYVGRVSFEMILMSFSLSTYGSGILVFLIYLPDLVSIWRDWCGLNAVRHKGEVTVSKSSVFARLNRVKNRFSSVGVSHMSEPDPCLYTIETSHGEETGQLNGESLPDSVEEQVSGKNKSLIISTQILPMDEDPLVPVQSMPIESCDSVRPFANDELDVEMALTTPRMTITSVVKISDDLICDDI